MIFGITANFSISTKNLCKSANQIRLNNMSDSNTALEEALKLHQQGKFESAQSLLRQHLKINPHSADGLHLMALCYHATDQNEVALEFLEKAIVQKPEEVVFLSNAGMIAFG